MLPPLRRLGTALARSLWKLFFPALSRKRLASTVAQPSAKRARTAGGARSISPTRTNEMTNYKLHPTQRDNTTSLSSAGILALQQQHTPQHQSPSNQLNVRPQTVQAMEVAATSDLHDNDDGWQQHRRRRPCQHNRPDALQNDDAGRHQQQGVEQLTYGNGSAYLPRRGSYSGRVAQGNNVGQHEAPSHQHQQQHQWQRNAGQGSMRPPKQQEHFAKLYGWQTRKLEQDAVRAARAAPNDIGVLREALEQAKGPEYFAVPTQRRKHVAHPPARPEHLERYARVLSAFAQHPTDSWLGRRALATTSASLRTLLADPSAQQSMVPEVAISRGRRASLPSYRVEAVHALASPQPTARCHEPESNTTSAPSAAISAAVQGLKAELEKSKTLCTVSPDPRNLEIQAVQGSLKALKLSRLQLRDQEALRAELRIEPKEDSALVPLSEEAQALVHRVLYGKGRREEVLTSHKESGYEISREKMACLRPLEWLNDEVINLYLHLLQERQARYQQKGQSPYPRCHFFNTFFYNKLFADGRQYNYGAVRRWTLKKRLGYSLKDCDKVIVPIHQQVHWCLAIVNMRNRKLEYYDSMGGQDRACLENLARYITEEVAHKDDAKLDTSDWPRVFPKDIPEQRNSCDCGVFMVKYADYQSRNAPFTFSQDNMEYFRQRMVWELMQLRAD
eukprot:jgi/Chlat1/7872/Chrsp66S09177